MNVSEFDYELPPDRIAQRPAERRDRSRLMLLDRESGRTVHARFHELGRWLAPGDLLVLNDTAVLPARLTGRKESGGRIEVTLLEPLGAGRWGCLLKGARKPRPGGRLRLPGGLRAAVRERRGEVWVLRFEGAGGGIDRRLEEVGLMPLPPYIRRPDPSTADGRRLAELDRRRYQTVFARRRGAIAAPTAGLHFTPELLGELRRDGVEQAFLTLHVGAGTFLPVRAERVEDHALHEERFDLPESTAEAVARTRRRGGRVVAVGTTVVRTLEHRGRADGTITPGRGRCDLFIYPGYEFRVVDAVITNFHLPRSTLLMLVCAFGGRERVLRAYAEAIDRGYRFYSYGDAMLLGSRP